MRWKVWKLSKIFALGRKARGILKINELAKFSENVCKNVRNCYKVLKMNEKYPKNIFFLVTNKIKKNICEILRQTMKNPKCIENLRHMLRSLGNIKNHWKFRNLAKMFTKGQKLLKGIEILDKWRTKCYLIENNPKTSQIYDILRNMLKNPKSIKNLQNMMQNPINCENRWKCQNLPMMLTKHEKWIKNVVNLQVMWRFAASAK